MPTNEAPQKGITNTDGESSVNAETRDDSVDAEAKARAERAAARDHGIKTGRNKVITELLELSGKATYEEVAELLKNSQTEQARRAQEKAKAEADVKAKEAAIAERDALIEKLMVENAVFPVLSSLGVRRPKQALSALQDETGYTLAVVDGAVKVKDRDGTALADDYTKLLTAQFKRPEFADLIKPPTSITKPAVTKPATGAKDGNGKSTPVDFQGAMRSALARTGSGETQED